MLPNDHPTPHAAETRREGLAGHIVYTTLYIPLLSSTSSFLYTTSIALLWEEYQVMRIQELSRTAWITIIGWPPCTYPILCIIACITENKKQLIIIIIIIINFILTRTTYIHEWNLWNARPMKGNLKRIQVFTYECVMRWMNIVKKRWVETKTKYEHRKNKWWMDNKHNMIKWRMNEHSQIKMIY